MSAGVIVYVEDDPDMRLVCTSILRDAGFEVYAVASCAAAREVVIAAGAGVVVTELDLPDGSGLDLARELRAAPGSSDVRVVMLSGWCSRSAIAAALEAGCHAFLAKPLDRDELVGAVRAEIDARRAARGD